MSLSAARVSFAGGDDDSTYEPDESYSPESTATPGGKPKRKSAAGRKLQRWDPAKDQYVLLCVEVYVATANFPFDWNEVAKFIGPTVTGEAIKQHLAKVRRQREDAQQEVPPKISKEKRLIRGGNLLAQTKTPRRPKAIDKEQDPFFDEAPDSKINLLFVKGGPAKNRAAQIKAEGDRPPASRKRKNTPDGATPTATKRGKKQKIIESSFKTGLETDHLRAQFEMDIANSIGKPIPVNTPTNKVNNLRRRNMAVVDSVETAGLAGEVPTSSTNQGTNMRLRGVPPVNYDEVDGAAAEDFEIIQSPPTPVKSNQFDPATTAMTQSLPPFIMHGLPVSAVTTPLVLTPDFHLTPAAAAGPSQQASKSMDAPFGNGDSFNFNDILAADENFVPNFPAVLAHNQSTTVTFAGPSQQALVGMDEGITNDGVFVFTNPNDIFPGFDTGLSEVGGALSGGNTNWLTNDPGAHGASSRAQHPKMDDHTAMMAVFDGANMGGSGMDAVISPEGFDAAVPGKTGDVGSRNDSLVDGFVDVKLKGGVLKTAENDDAMKGDGAAGAAPEPKFEDWTFFELEEGAYFEGFDGPAVD